MSASDGPISPDDLRLIARALAQELSEDELQGFRLWLEADPRRRWEFKQLERIWMSAGRPRHEWDADAALRAIRSRAALEALAEESVGRAEPAVPLAHWQREHRKSRIRGLGWAAAAVLAGAVGLAGWWASRAPVPAPAPARLAFREVHTDRGETAGLRFPDGTEVRLAPETRLRYPVDMLGASRDLDLTGEAYIVAGPRGHAPLVIHTAYGTTRDIGTRFLVRAHPGARLDVVVVEGLVVIRSTRSGADRLPGDSLVLPAGSLGTITADGTLRERRGVQVNRYLSWLDGRLEFSDTPIAEVLATLARWRALDYRVVDPAVSTRRFTGSLDPRESLDGFLEILALTANLRISRTDDTTLIRNDPARPIHRSPARP
jgi:transmembrane sensor